MQPNQGPFNGEVFDATGFAPPPQSFPTHPEGSKFPFAITNTSIVPNSDQAKDPKGFTFQVEFTTPAGKIIRRHNLWNTSAQAVDIAQKEMLSLSYATGVFRIDLRNNQGRELLGARGMLDVVKNGDFSNVSKLYDSAGNEPGVQGQTASPQAQAFQTPAPAPQTQFAPQPQQQPAQQQSSFPQGGQPFAPPQTPQTQFVQTPQQQQPSFAPAPAPQTQFAPQPQQQPSGAAPQFPDWANRR